MNLFVWIVSCTLLSTLWGCSVDNSQKYPQEILAASKKFKKSFESKHQTAPLLLRYIKPGMLKKDVVFLLGSPDTITRDSRNEIWAYATFYSQFIRLMFEKDTLVDVSSTYP